MRFRDRTDAGRHLAARLAEYGGRSDVVVLALPRGGVPVASEVATRLKAPLDVFLVRKLGVPGHPELAMGAIAEGGVEVLSEDLIRDLSIPRNPVASKVRLATAGAFSAACQTYAIAPGNSCPAAVHSARSSFMTRPTAVR